MLSETNKGMLKDLERLTAELAAMKRTIKPKATDSMIINSMLEHNNNKSRVAKALGVTYKTIHRRWKKLSNLNTNPKVNVNVPIPRALETIREFIKKETKEWEDRERYGKIGICMEAMDHLKAVEKFVEAVCDDDWYCTSALGD